jgi:N-acetylmuramoyl-L-alanine amidase
MLARRKNFHKMFARFSPVFVLLGFATFSALPSEGSSESATNNSARREAASAQFERAVNQRAALNEEPLNQRKLDEYKQVVTSYRRVYLITPHAARVPDALLAIAELYTEMGDRFGRNYYQLAVESYQFLIHEYPTSSHHQEAMLRAAHLAKDQLNDPALASKTYNEFLKAYPHSPHKREVQEALAELTLLQENEKPAEAAAPAKAAAGNANSDTEDAYRSPAEGSTLPVPSPTAPPRVRRIGVSTSAESTTVTIDLEDTVQYASGRVSNPDRIFFDLHDARLTPEVAKQNIQVDGNLLSAVRVAQNHTGVVRVVLDVNGVQDYEAHLQSDPPQLIIDLYSTPHKTITARASSSKRSHRPSSADVGSSEAPGTTDVDAPAVKPAAVKRTSPADSSPVNTNTPPNKTTSAKTNAHAKSVAPNSTVPDLIQPLAAPSPTRDGQATLTRTLGLKINRIVIDAGHGGHDTGTIGPTGLMEKDLCLDVALRLGKIIQQRLPGAEVVFTRSDDTFIPLEERTRTANETKADLFISIHANSSANHGTRGIETYYLNLKGSPEAMQVAARENAAYQGSVHDLEDLVKKITRNEKIDESREFAVDIQESLSKRAQKISVPLRDRGVRKAPFVVLIGADMPSVLTEISFLSNPSDEQLLKKPEYRQRVAEGLYQGVASYLQSLNSMTVNLPKLPLKSPSRAEAVASVEQSRNQR